MAQHCWPDHNDRAWLEVNMCQHHGTPIPLKLIADLGCPLPLIVRPRALARSIIKPVPTCSSNFGTLGGGLARVGIAHLQFSRVVPVFASAKVVFLVSSEGFDGLAGKPFLDLFLWSNGKGREFCLTYPTVTTKE